MAIAFQYCFRNVSRMIQVNQEQMNDQRKVAKTIYNWKLYATRPKGRPRVRWEDDVRNDLRNMGVNNWKQMMQERKKWKGIIE